MFHNILFPANEVLMEELGLILGLQAPKALRP